MTEDSPCPARNCATPNQVSQRASNHQDPCPLPIHPLSCRVLSVISKGIAQSSQINSILPRPHPLSSPSRSSLSPPRLFSTTPTALLFCEPGRKFCLWHHPSGLTTPLPKHFLPPSGSNLQGLASRAPKTSCCKLPTHRCEGFPQRTPQETSASSQYAAAHFHGADDAQLVSSPTRITSPPNVTLPGSICVRSLQ